MKASAKVKHQTLRPHLSVRRQPRPKTSPRPHRLRQTLAECRERLRRATALGLSERTPLNFSPLHRKGGQIGN